MTFAKCAMTLLCLVSLLSLSYLVNFLHPLAATEDNHLNVLKYEVNNVYVEKLKHAIRIYNSASVEIRGGKLFVPIIRNETARHYVILYNISSSTPPTIRNDTSGNIYAYWNNITIDGHKTLNVKLNYYLVSFSINYLINSSSITDYNVSSDLYQKYTQPEELIQSNNSEIVSLAQDLTANASDWHSKVLKIYDFVIEHLKYRTQSEERGALWALENRIGDCSEYSYLFVALCRAAGIPARVQAGFAFHEYSETLEDGHMWTEYYLENYGWIPVDATWRLFDAIDERHFSSIQSIPEVIQYTNFFFNYTSGPEEKNVEDAQLVSLKPCSTDVLGDSFTENVANTVQKIRQAKFAIFLGKVFGTHLIFASEAKEIGQTFLESEIQIQNAIDFWDENPKIAESNVVNALENAEKTLQNAWMLIVKAFTIFISIPIVIMLIGLFFLKRYQTKQEMKREQKFHLRDALILS